ncbi:tyrosine-type recombinase/integrase [Trichococcus collinsii]|uniref:Site-specific recombinase XerD n=2 Tax=Trichococcus collinsii TaxID=157076 RepID=A0AB38A3T3_9LACT|nr:site-specific integrase [Trichococcus collinsii]CZR10835.1 integrase catalytic [Trichococcus collinsii]SEA93761.1 Site-specific recombinase XerD [Trichococcus collinsii]
MISEYQKKNGKKAWMFNEYIGTDRTTGVQKYATKRGFRSEREARTTLNRMRSDFERGELQATNRIKFKDVYDIWMEEHRRMVKQGTVVTTKRYARLHVLPKLGNKYVQSIDLLECQRAVNEWSEHFASAKYPKGIAQQVLDYAMLLGYIKENPMRKVRLPKRVSDLSKLDNYYNLDELKFFFECVKDYNNPKMSMFFRLLAFTGARKSEVLALQWGDIDFNGKTINITKTVSLDESENAIITTPKTKKSIRKISIDDQTLIELRQWKTIQSQYYLAKGINIFGLDQFLFTTKENKIYLPTLVNEWLYYLEKKYPLKHITLHGFRHTHCSLLFEMGTPLEEVQERLGHTDIKTTMNIYTHVTEKRKEKTAEKFAKFVNF